MRSRCGLRQETCRPAHYYGTPRGLTASQSRPADVFTTAAVPGRSAALDVCVASSIAAAARGDAAQAAFDRNLAHNRDEIGVPAGNRVFTAALLFGRCVAIKFLIAWFVAVWGRLFPAGDGFPAQRAGRTTPQFSVFRQSPPREHFRGQRGSQGNM